MVAYVRPIFQACMCLCMQVSESEDDKDSQTVETMAEGNEAHADEITRVVNAISPYDVLQVICEE